MHFQGDIPYLVARLCTGMCGRIRSYKSLCRERCKKTWPLSAIHLCRMHAERDQVPNRGFSAVKPRKKRVSGHNRLGGWTWFQHMITETEPGLFQCTIYICAITNRALLVMGNSRPWNPRREMLQVICIPANKSREQNSDTFIIGVLYVVTRSSSKLVYFLTYSCYQVFFQVSLLLNIQLLPGLLPS
jgi:hypothetical protein